jgi:hypothetical protein
MLLSICIESNRFKKNIRYNLTKNKIFITENKKLKCIKLNPPPHKVRQNT